jgi:hypothetical protein
MIVLAMLRLNRYSAQKKFPLANGVQKKSGEHSDLRHSVVSRQGSRNQKSTLSLAHCSATSCNLLIPSEQEIYASEEHYLYKELGKG